MGRVSWVCVEGTMFVEDQTFELTLSISGGEEIVQYLKGVLGLWMSV